MRGTRAKRLRKIARYFSVEKDRRKTYQTLKKKYKFYKQNQ